MVLTERIFVEGALGRCAIECLGTGYGESRSRVLRGVFVEYGSDFLKNEEEIA